MYEFGDSTNSNREQISQQEIAIRSSNAVSDDNKNQYQFSTGLIISNRINTENNTGGIIDSMIQNYVSKNDLVEYIVLLEREQREIVATHKGDYSFWSKLSFPTPGDRVRIKHKKDLFQAEIIEVLTATRADAIAKYGSITKTAG